MNSLSTNHRINKSTNFLSPCPWSGAAHCGKHTGFCERCGMYGRMTRRDKIVTAIIAATLILATLITVFGR